MIAIGAENIGKDRRGYNQRRFADLPSGVSCLVIGIRDTGEGMVPEVREKLFEPFSTSKTAGTGLGLRSSCAL